MSLHRLREPVLVLGATSLVGRYLAPRLVEQRAVTLALSRRPMDEDPCGIRWIAGDLGAPDTIAFPFAETVLSLCPIWLLPPALPALAAAGVRRLVAFSSTSVSGKANSSNAEERAVAARIAAAEADVRRLCEAHDIAWTLLRPTLIYSEGRDGNVSRLAALAAAGVRRLVAFSSTSVSGKAKSSNAEERAVAARLAAAEAEVRRLCEAHDIAWTLLRPTLIYSEGHDGNVSRLAALAERFGVLPLAGAGRGLRQPVHAEDLAWAAMAAAASPTTPGRAYDLPGGETLTYKAMVERIFLGLDRTPRIVCAPLVLWRLGLRLAGNRLPGATAAMGERMNQDLTFDGGPAARDFGWAPRTFKPVFPCSEDARSA